MRWLLLLLFGLSPAQAAYSPDAVNAVESTAKLRNIPATAAPFVMRMGYYAAGDAPPLIYKASTTACPLNAGNGDEGSEVKSFDGKCWLAQWPTDGVDARQFGAKCDGSTNDGPALQRWLNYGVSTRAQLRLPASDCATQQTLVAGPQPNGLTIEGASAYFGIKYTGASTTADIVSIGTVWPASSTVRLGLRKFRIWSQTVMTDGAGLHLKNVGRVTMSNLMLDGQDGNGNLWNGVWFDQATKVWYSTFEARAQNDAVRLNGTAGAPGPKSDIFLAQCSIGGSGVGVHIGGAFGGVYIDQCGIDANQSAGILHDQALAAEPNREVFIGVTTALDSNLSDGYRINDLGGNQTITLCNWNSGNVGHGLNIAAFNGKISICGGRWFSNQLSAIQFGPGSVGTVLKISQGWDCSDNVGYCIDTNIGAVHVWWAGYNEDFNNNPSNPGLVAPGIYLTAAASAFGLVVPNGGSVSLPGITGTVEIAEVTTGRLGVYRVGTSLVAPISLDPTVWVAPTTTPAAGFASVQWDGTASYRIYNNIGGGARTFRILSTNPREVN